MSTQRKTAILILFLLLTVASWGATPSFAPDAYLRHIKFLASDDLRGRGNGTPELDKAAEYIAEQFKTGGLAPAGEEGSYFQRFLVTTGSQLGPNNKLTLRIGERSIVATLHKDFVPISVGEMTEVSGDIVFAGYGITADEYQYDDYKNLDVTDKIVLILAHEPRENDPSSTFNGVEMTMHGQDNNKALTARYSKARAILIVQDPTNHDDPSLDLPTAAAGAQVDELGICGLRITRALAQQILDGQQRNLLELQKQIDEKMAPQSFALQSARADLELDVTKVRKEVRNVVGLLAGSDPSVADETVIIGAHYDHLGLGGRSSMLPQLIGQVHHGADDNASGAAGIIELAAALAKDPLARRRAYLFIAFAGEELGLRGSDYWTNHPTRPLGKVVAMINLDMIGRVRNGQVILSGIGTSAAFPDLVKTAAAEAGLEARTSRSGYGGSDHQSFYTKNLPVLFFFSNLHSDYHRPSDTWDKINAAGALRILEMVYAVVTSLNRMEARPLFTKVDEPSPVGSPRGAGGPGYGTYFGSIPDMTDEVKGVRFTDVRPNSPAAKAGLRGQDILVKFAGNQINNLEDFTFMLRTHKPGETVEVVVLRDGKPLTVQVILETRR